MIYALLITVLILNSLYSALKIPLDFAYTGFVLTREVNRPFALATYVAIGIMRDVLFLSKPWYSSLLMTLGVILINRVRPHWITLSATTLLIYALDIALRLLLWKVRVDFQEVTITSLAIVAVSSAYFRIKTKEFTLI